MASRVLEPDEVREILSELVKRLDARGEEAVIHVIGGAAIALMNPARVATEDVDGYIRLADASDVLAELEGDYGLTSGWFNWRAQGLQPPVAGPDMWQEVYREGSVSLLAATRVTLGHEAQCRAHQGHQRHHLAARRVGNLRVRRC